uniref:Uncharacterized protein n=1 Tax=Picea glauca TaxID=3330 RepID=A0A124GNW6_PICGL|nr:hypothetical protein ABT39_MTgene3319 [Picea glauca]QHR88575.1 hypothetical protein Q903MT_gene2589 [Picea sitchensis]
MLPPATTSHLSNVPILPFLVDKLNKLSLALHKSESLPVPYSFSLLRLRAFHPNFDIICTQREYRASQFRVERWSVCIEIGANPSEINARIIIIRCILRTRIHPISVAGSIISPLPRWDCPYSLCLRYL